MTAGPMFYLSAQFLQSGRLSSGLFIGAMAVAGFFLPGFLINRFLAVFTGLKHKAVVAVVSRVPSPLLSVCGVKTGSTPPDDPDSND